MENRLRVQSFFTEAILSATIGRWRVCCPAFSDKPSAWFRCCIRVLIDPIKGVKSFANRAELSRAEENKRLALLTTIPIHQDSIAKASNSSASAEKISCLVL
jgi:hypothetical protein